MVRSSWLISGGSDGSPRWGDVAGAVGMLSIPWMARTLGVSGVAGFVDDHRKSPVSISEISLYLVERP